MPLAPHNLRIAAPWSMSRRSGMILLFLLVPALIFLDYRAGPGFSMRLFYLLPTALAAWVLGRKRGMAVAVISAGFCAFVDTQTRPHGATALELIWDAGSNLTLFLVFAIVVARHRKFMNDALAATRLDDETGLLSHREFERIFEAEVKRAKRYRRPVALVVIECAGLKGDAAALLAAVGRVAQQHVREGDSIARAGERRLGVTLLECMPANAALVLARIRGALEQAMSQKLGTGNLALGVVCYGGHSDSSPAELLMLVEAQVRVARGEKGVGVADANVP